MKDKIKKKTKLLPPESSNNSIKLSNSSLKKFNLKPSKTERYSRGSLIYLIEVKHSRTISTYKVP